MTVKTVTHSQQQPQAPQVQKKEVNSQIDLQNQCSVSPNGLFFTGSWS